MNTNVIIGIVVAAIIVIGGGVWYTTSHQTPTVTATQTAETGTQPTANPSGSGSINDLALMAGSLQCDVTSTDTTSAFTGKVYTSGGQMRVDSVVNSSGKTINSHMIRGGGFFYTWSDLMPQGIKIPESMATAQSGNAPAPASSRGSVNSTAKVSYTCLPWIADTSVFTPPANITFMTIPTSATTMPHGVPTPTHATY